MTTRKTGTWVVVSAFWVSTMLLLVGTAAWRGHGRTLRISGQVLRLTGDRIID